MIPNDGSVDITWSEFEYYYTNDHVRKLLNTEVDTTVNATPSNIA